MFEPQPLIGVIGSGTDAYTEMAEPLGAWIAQQGFNLINGGGPGVMESVSRGFAKVADRKGMVLGILPSGVACDLQDNRRQFKTPSGYPNPYIDLPIQTHLHLSGAWGKQTASRNHIIVLTADTIVAFPGGPGTRSEIQLALDYKKPLVVINAGGLWDEFAETDAKIAVTGEEAQKILGALYPPKMQA